MLAACALVIGAFVLAPTASAGTLVLRFVDPDGPATGQPQDAKVGATIRTADLNSSSGFIQIEVIDTGTNARSTTFNKPIGFELQTGAGFASGTLNVTPQIPVNGVATFGTGTLSIGTENEPEFTSYSLVPVTTRGPKITGPASDGFDVWEDGESCTGGTDTCDASLVPGNGLDTYKLQANGSLGASELFGELPGLTCPGQRLIFDNRIFSYATTENDGVPNTPVLLESHITKQDWKASANNGQAHADWCIGLLTSAPWENNGANFREIDTNGDAAGGVLFVALAPKCPTANPSGSAPCFVSQNSDGNGGSITIGWLPGGDPPRRT